MRTRQPMHAQWRGWLRALGPLIAAVTLALVAALQPAVQAQGPSPGPALLPTAAAEPPKPDQRFVTVSSGDFHTCALRANGKSCAGAPVRPTRKVNLVLLTSARPRRRYVSDSRPSVVAASTPAACGTTEQVHVGGRTTATWRRTWVRWGSGRQLRRMARTSPPSAAAVGIRAGCARTVQWRAGETTNPVRPRRRTANDSWPSPAVPITHADFEKTAWSFAGDPSRDPVRSEVGKPHRKQSSHQSMGHTGIRAACRWRARRSAGGAIRRLPTSRGIRRRTCGLSPSAVAEGTPAVCRRTERRCAGEIWRTGRH